MRKAYVKSSNLLDYEEGGWIDDWQSISFVIFTLNPSMTLRASKKLYFVNFTHKLPLPKGFTPHNYYCIIKPFKIYNVWLQTQRLYNMEQWLACKVSGTIYMPNTLSSSYEHLRKFWGIRQELEGSDIKSSTLCRYFFH